MKCSENALHKRIKEGKSRSTKIRRKNVEPMECTANTHAHTVCELISVSIRPLTASVAHAIV